MWGGGTTYPLLEGVIAAWLFAMLLAPAHTQPVAGTADVTETMKRLAIDLPWSVSASPAIHGNRPGAGRLPP